MQGEISTWRWVSHARFSIRREMLAHIPYQRDLFPRASKSQNYVSYVNMLARTILNKKEAPDSGKGSDRQ